ncbi:probable tubulin polyglutamylase TTLL2 isoform X2 [Betta splendens]|uniref:Probable tubulin polyglutamylase TTLL2 isoform X2 n=1 Tax=Betta splendens TaxID=158456 RepID=A0A6P7LRT6_BETSP|nr:probable tubulin polyglutamylase TTLL2 isoform X2 [Betta splendens]
MDVSCDTVAAARQSGEFRFVGGGAQGTEASTLQALSWKGLISCLLQTDEQSQVLLSSFVHLRCCMAASLVFKLHDRGPELVREVLLERGWQEYDGGRQEEEDWNLYWRGSMFGSSEYHNLLPWQRLNHHPKTAGITRKDLLARNLRRMRATMGSALYDFSPTAFILPTDYTRLLAQCNRLQRRGGASVYWICKPVDLSRGRGIFLFDHIKDLVYDCPVIVQRYISNPLLISGYKFDLRIYVCVKSFHPLTVYVHQEGLVRFATEKYDLSSLHNVYAHLTNTSINKSGPFYKTKKGRVGPGCKWTLGQFRHFLHSQDVNELLLWQRINNIVTLTLLTIAPTVPYCPNCVELFGFDVLVDAKYKPWLLEVNYSPALTLDCQADVIVKKSLISDLIDLMNYTPADRLRERAHQEGRYRACCRANKPSRVPVPVLPNKVQRKTSGLHPSHVHRLPLLKNPHLSEKINQRESRQQAFITSCQTHLPPVGLNATECRIIEATGAKNHTNKALNLILSTDSRRNVSGVNERTLPATAPRRTRRRRLHVSEVTQRDAAETEVELETDASSSILDVPRRRLETRASAASWTLPNIYSGNKRLVSFPLEASTAVNGPPVPPLRVGDFIRTFPFNPATLKASRLNLDVRTVTQELHKLTAELASAQSDSSKLRTEEEDGTDAEAGADFESLLWGPKDPPLISQRFRTS